VLKQREQPLVTRWFSSSPAARAQAHQLPVCSSKNVPETASTLYGWCLSHGPKDDKSKKGENNHRKGKKKKHNNGNISVCL